jgi:hypothetical protein
MWVGDKECNDLLQLRDKQFYKHLHPELLRQDWNAIIFSKLQANNYTNICVLILSQVKVGNGRKTQS